MIVDLFYKTEATKEGKINVIRFASIIKARKKFKQLDAQEEPKLLYAYIRKWDGWRYHNYEELKPKPSV